MCLHRYLHSLQNLPTQRQDPHQETAEGEQVDTPGWAWLHLKCLCGSAGHSEEAAVGGAERHPEAPPAGADAELHHSFGERKEQVWWFLPPEQTHMTET